MLEVSFIIPFYNGELTIKRCLDSIYSIGMDENQFEIIIVDDCSPVDAQSALDDYLSCHNNICVIRHETNKCQGGAKNTGIKAARGKYILFADQDDYVIPENQKLAIDRVLATCPDLLACQWIVKKEDGTEDLYGLDLPNGLSENGKTYCETWFDAGECLAPWSYLYKREYLVNMNRPMAENVMMEDADWVAWHLFYADRVEFMSIPIYCWVMNPTSITHGLTWRHKADWVKFGYRKIKDSERFLTDSPCFGAIMKKDGKYNIEHVFKKLWKIDDYSLFYQHISDVMEDLKTMRWSKMTSFMLRHPIVVCVCLNVIGPVMKSIRLVNKRFMEKGI